MIHYLKNIIRDEAKKKFYVIITLSVLVSLAVVLTPVIISRLTSLLQHDGHSQVNVIFALGVAYVLIISLEKVVSFVSVYLQNVLRMQCIACVSEDYLLRIYRRKQSPEMSNAGDMSQRLSQASNDIYVMVRNIALTLFPPVIQLTLAIVFILNSGDVVISLMFLLYAMTFVFMNYFFIKKLLVAREQLMDSGRNTYRLLADSVQNIPVVRSFNSFSFFFDRFRKFLREDVRTQDAYWKLDFANIASASLIQIVFFCSAFIYTLYNVMYGATTLAHFILISSYLMVITGPLEHLASSFITFSQSYNSFRSFISFLGEGKEQTGTVTEFMGEGHVRVSLDEVTAGYEPDGKVVLGPLSVAFRHGAFTTITGRSGAGKSTLVKLIMRQLHPAQGSYTIGGIDAFTLDDDLFFSTVAYVSQDEFVFMDTVAFNLEIASPGASRDDLLNALEMADFRLPDVTGADILDKVLSNEGSNLSGGQRQRLSLARLFLRNPSIIILDEITSSLDVPSEISLLSRIRSKFPDATILNISHRPSAFTLSDDIMIIEDGKVADHGTYDDIRRRNPYLLSIMAEESAGT